MKLVLKRIEKTVEVTALSDPEPRHVNAGYPGPFALHTEDGQVLPCQVSTNMESSRGEPVRLTVVFNVDGRDLVVEGDPV